MNALYVRQSRTFIYITFFQELQTERTVTNMDYGFTCVWIITQATMESIATESFSSVLCSLHKGHLRKHTQEKNLWPYSVRIGFKEDKYEHDNHDGPPDA